MVGTNLRNMITSSMAFSEHSWIKNVGGMAKDMACLEIKSFV